VEGCRQLKAAGRARLCYINHNMELALEWLESQRAVMHSPDTSGYFLQYPNGTVYDEPITFGSQLFWDYRNSDAAKYFISSVTASLASDAVDGTFTDDVDGVPDEHPDVQARIGMSDVQLAALQWATSEASSALISTLVLAGKYNWQAFGASDGVGAGISAASCLAFMRAGCDPAMQGRAMTMAMDNSPANANQSVAAFLIVRPPYGYLGFGWESGDEKWNDLFLLQAGEPLGLCAETATGVFSRAWSLGVAQLDCNTYTATLPFASL
jgi:hypothetical protein